MKLLKLILSFLFVFTSLLLVYRGVNSLKQQYVAESFPVSWKGRVQACGDNVYCMAYPGTGFSFNVKTQSSVNVELELLDSTLSNKHEGDFVQVEIDGHTEKVELYANQLSKHTFNIIGDANDSAYHNFDLTKLTESQVGTIYVKSIRICSNDNFDIYPSVSEPRSIEFIGNSITCGYGNEDSTNHVGFTSRNQNIQKTYAALVAEHYHSQSYFTAYSGRGLLHNFDGSSDGVIPVIYNRILPDDSSSCYHPNSCYTPNLIVLNVGTNDFSAEINTGIAVDSAQFVNEMVSFILRLHSYYPKAKFVNTVGPMLNDGYPMGQNHLTKAIRYQTTVVDLVKNQGVEAYFMSYTPQTPPYGEDYHPSARTHEQMAKELISMIDSVGVVF